MEEPTWYREIEALVTVGDAAEVLRVHPNTIYNWIHSGKLRAFKIGRAWRIPKENLLCLSDGSTSIPQSMEQWEQEEHLAAVTGND